MFVVYLETQLEMIDVLADGLPELKKVLFNGVGQEWRRRMEASDVECEEI